MATRSRMLPTVNTRSTDLRGLEGSKRDLHHDDYRLSSRAKCLRAAAKGREEMVKAMETVGEKGKGWVVTTHRETGDSARVRGAGTGLKVGMFVVRVIWPIKPRGGARCTPASPFADRRSSGRASQPRDHAGMGVKRARKRREQEHVAQATPRIALDARAVPPISEARFPLATRDGTLDRPRLRRGRDTSSYAPHYRSEGPRSASPCIDIRSRHEEKERERETETKRVPYRSLLPCSSRESSRRNNTRSDT